MCFLHISRKVPSQTLRKKYYNFLKNNTNKIHWVLRWPNEMSSVGSTLNIQHNRYHNAEKHPLLNTYNIKWMSLVLIWLNDICTCCIQGDLVPYANLYTSRWHLIAQWKENTHLKYINWIRWIIARLRLVKALNIGCSTWNSSDTVLK